MRFLDTITQQYVIVRCISQAIWLAFVYQVLREILLICIKHERKTTHSKHLRDSCLPWETCITFPRRDYSSISEMAFTFIPDLPVSAGSYLRHSLQTLPAAELPLIWLCSGSFLLCIHSVLSHCLSPGLESLKSARKQQTVFFLCFLRHFWRERRRGVTSFSAKGERKYSLQYTKMTCLACKSHQNIFSWVPEHSKREH